MKTRTKLVALLLLCAVLIPVAYACPAPPVVEEPEVKTPVMRSRYRRTYWMFVWSNGQWVHNDDRTITYDGDYVVVTYNNPY